MSFQPSKRVEGPRGAGQTEDQERRRNALLGSLSGGLPTLPGYVFELNSLLGADPVDLKRVSEVIRTDPSLTAQVIRLCHSERPNLEHRVVNIDEAVLLLGTERLRTLALTCSLLEYSGERLAHDEVRAFWQHSFITALLSERLARGVRYSQPEQAYLGGLLHDIGALPLLTYLRDEEPGVALFIEAGPADSTSWEQKFFGLDHCELGYKIGTLWHFPLPLIEVFKYHHEPEKGTQDRNLLGLVAAADRIVRKWGVVFGIASPKLEIVDKSEYDAILHECLPELDSEARGKILESIAGEFQDLIQMLESGSLGLFTVPRRANAS